jgi:carbonyl reductase 1
MMSTVSGRVAVVTGSNKGIGYFIALQLGLSNLFEHVLLACRDESRAADAVASLQAQLPNKVKVSSASLTLGNTESHRAFAKQMEESFGKVDVLVNNAGFAFKGSDSTPFKEQCTPTLDINFRGTVDLTNRLLPLIEKGTDPRVVNVASMAGRLAQLSPELQSKFSSNDLTMAELESLVDQFETAVHDGTQKDKGWGNSNYGISKLAVIAATKVWAREYADKGTVSINCCCPGYCKTDMTSAKGVRDPADGAKNAVIPATMENPPTGQFFENFKVGQW